MKTGGGSYAEVLTLLPVSRRRLGDTDAKVAFARILGAFYDQILALAYGILGDLQDAQDITQESFLKLHEQLANRSVDRQLISWLGAVARNAALDLRRKRKRGPDLVPIEAAGETPEEPLLSQDQVDLSRQIALLLSKLPDRKRSVFELRIIDGLGYEQIGEVVGCSSDAARMVFERAVSHIRHELARDLAQVAAAPVAFCEQPPPNLAVGDVEQP